jgi:hypothetical protein
MNIKLNNTKSISLNEDSLKSKPKVTETPVSYIHKFTVDN